MPGSQAVVSTLAQRYEIFVTTAAMDHPISFAAKYEWLCEYFPLSTTATLCSAATKASSRLIAYR